MGLGLDRKLNKEDKTNLKREIKGEPILKTQTDKYANKATDKQT